MVVCEGVDRVWDNVSVGTCGQSLGVCEYEYVWTKIRFV